MIISDPELNPVAKNDSTLIFLFKNNTKHLWSWVQSDSNSIINVELLNGTLPFRFTNEKIEKYIVSLQDSSSANERSFLLNKANYPLSSKLLDLFEYKDVSDRILLYQDSLLSNDNVFIVHRLSKNKLDLAPFELRLVGSKDLNDVKPLYNINWKRIILKNRMVQDNIPLDYIIWLSNIGFGYIRTKNQLLVNVYPNQYCMDYENIPFECVNNRIDYITYKPSGLPLQNMLFSSWLSSAWDKSIWRANPLGYLGRCQNL